MLKIITPSAWTFDAPVASQIKLSSRGLIGSDLSDFVKRAGYRFADAIKQIKVASDEIPVHLIAVGATEHYGPNRNGDGFRADHCRGSHDTFQKYARWYRHHKNKDKTKGRGIIKYSAFNEEMQRIELLVALNAEKSAADRNGGLIADDEIAALARGEDIPVSMACKIAFDVCSGCGNKAKTRLDYCDEQTCKYGGLRSNIGQIYDDGHILHADNPNPLFFDISKVVRPADRIAYTLGNMQKAAGDRLLTGSELAEAMELSAPRDVLLSGQGGVYFKLACLLADLEESAEGLVQNPSMSGALVSQEPLHDLPTDISDNPQKLAGLVSAMADCDMILPVEEFLYVFSGGNRQKAAAASEEVKSYLPGIFGRIVAEDADTVDNNPYATEHRVPPSAYRSWAQKHSSEYALTQNHIEQRVRRTAIRGQLPTTLVGTAREKRAMDGSSASLLAKQYALYKLAALQRVKQHCPNFSLTSTLSVLQNYL